MPRIVLDAGEIAKHRLDINPVLVVPGVQRGRQVVTKQCDSYLPGVSQKSGWQGPIWGRLA